jgi:hypothetical protein
MRLPVRQPRAGPIAQILASTVTLIVVVTP